MSDTNIARLARQFLDVEAAIDDEEYDEQEVEDQDDDMGVFLRDESETGKMDETGETTGPQRMAIEDAPAEFWDNLMSNALAQARIARRHRETTNDDLLEHVVPFVPWDDDYPLWRVPCRRGVEGEAVVSLMQTANKKHQIRSAFSREAIPGYVYLECTMNTALRDLLQITPGIRGFSHRRREMIEAGEYAGVLEARDGIGGGEWVTIRHGLYKEDLGIVKSKDGWGVNVLVVPRLSPTSKSSQKRKATFNRPRALLLDVEEQRSSSRFRVKEKGPHKYRIGRLDFEHGLLNKYFDYTRIYRHPDEIPCQLLEAFKLSGHPLIDMASIPRPREWSFQIGDRVQIASTSRIGYIVVIETTYAEVDCSDDPSVHDEVRAPWNEIVKFFEVGNEVEILNGPSRGTVGWITQITNDISTVSIPQTEAKNIVVNPVQEIVSLNNNLRFHVSSLMLPQTEEASAPVISKAKHWWCGREVTIMKDRHPHRGERGVIVDVIPTNDPDVSKVQIEFKTYRPALPQLKTVILASDVRDVRTKKRLEGPEPSGKRYAVGLLMPSDVASGSQTPMPDEIYGGSTPAWDPNALSPTHAAFLNWSLGVAEASAPAPSPPKPTTSTPAHILLDPLFEGLQIKAMVNGDDFKNKECLVNIAKHGNSLIFTTKKQRSIVRLDPPSVTPKPVNAKLDDNLLVIVSGEHIGKLGRRIHHLDGLTGPTTIVLAVVERKESQADTLTGEQVHVSPGSVAIVVESGAEKQAKKKLMKDLRAPWQGK